MILSCRPNCCEKYRHLQIFSVQKVEFNVWRQQQYHRHFDDSMWIWWMEQFSVSLFIYNAFAIMNVIYLALNKPSCTRNKHIINLSKQRWQCEKAYVVYVAKPAYFGKFTRISPGNDSQRKIIEAFRLSKSKPSFEKCNHPCKEEKNSRLIRLFELRSI